MSDIRKILAFGEVSGLQLNAKKCEVFFVNGSFDEQDHLYAEISKLLPGIKKVDKSSFELLGASIFEEGLEKMFSSKTESVSLMCDRLKLMDVHPALCIFKKSLSTCRFSYLMRASRAYLLPDKLSEVDGIFRSTLEAITNVKLDDFSWDQATLPLSFGGMGIRKVSDLAFSAYVSSVHFTSELTDELLQKCGLHVIDDDIIGLINDLPEGFVPVNDELKGIQKNWDSPGIKSKFCEMFDASMPAVRARLLASSTKESSKWLQVVPSSQLGLLLDNNTARIAVGLRLGCNLCEEHKCVCGVNVKKDGIHGLSCRRSAGKIAIHDEINKIISHAFSSAGFPNILQPPGISRDDGKRPDGMTLIPWSHGRSILWDVTVRDTLAPSYVNESSEKACSIADRAERFKHNHYLALKDNFLLTPIAFESLGSMGPETRKFINKLGSLMIKATGETRSKDYLLQKISIAIQRGNSACILATLGKQRIDDFYYL